MPQDNIVEFSVEEMEHIETTSVNIPGRFRKARVDEIKRLVIGGHWQERISTVMFWQNGQLADAFHRIRAHIELGVPMRTLVLLNCTKEEVAAVDQHLRRSAGIQGKVLGKPTTMLPLATALGYGLDTDVCIDNYRRLELREKYADVIEFMQEHFRLKKFPVAAQLKVANEYIRIKANPNQLARLIEFGLVLKSNQPLKLPNDRSALDLNKYLGDHKFADNTLRSECGKKTLKCMRTFMRFKL